MNTYSFFRDSKEKFYRVIKDLDGNRWYYSVDPLVVLVTGFKEGFGGKVLSIRLDNGEVVSESGLMHTNANNLFEKTGVDIRDRHKSISFVFRDRREALLFQRGESSESASIYSSGWVVGEFEESKALAENFADSLENEEKLQILTITENGSSIYTYETSEKRTA